MLMHMDRWRLSGVWRAISNMEVTQIRFTPSERCLPVQLDNVSLSNLNVLNAILHVAENRFRWRVPPICFRHSSWDLYRLYRW